jgi:hypothetical protein
VLDTTHQEQPALSSASSSWPCSSATSRPISRPSRSWRAPRSAQTRRDWRGGGRGGGTPRGERMDEAGDIVGCHVGN